MQYFHPSTRFTRSLRGAVLVLTALATVASSVPVHADDAELAETSSLTGIKLPSETVRMTDVPTIDKLMLPIREAAKPHNLQIDDREVLAWGDPAKRQEKVKKEVIASLNAEGFETEMLGEPMATEAGKMQFFMATRKAPKLGIFAYWIDGNEALILNWASMSKAGGAAAPADKPAVEKPKVTQTPAAGTRDVGDLEGKWGFTTISGTTYWDKNTGAYLGSGTGGSQTYTILPGGKYKFFNYIKSRMYGWETQIMTWEEGTVTLNGNKITFTPSEGKYQVIDNQVAKNNYTRPKTDEELKKGVRTSFWRMTNEDGKPVLVMADKPGADVKYRQQKD